MKDDVLDTHQIKAKGEMHNGCIVRGSVGSGKSRVGVAYYYDDVCGGGLRLGGRGEYRPPVTPIPLYIITTAKKRDDREWEAELALFGLSTTRGQGVADVPIAVDSWNNITNYEDVKGAFFIFDEQRLVGSGAWVKAFLKMAKNNQWIMLSATPGDTWLDYIPVFMANGYYATRGEFLREHVVYNSYTKFPKVERYLNVGKLESYRRKVLVEMPVQRHTKRHVLTVPCDYDQELWDQVWTHRWHPYEERPIRDIAEMCMVARRVVNSDPSRLGETMKLLERHQKLIMFYNFDYELGMLRTLQSTIGIQTAEWNGHKHMPIPATDAWLYVVQYAAGSEGWNCVGTDATAFWSLNYSYRVNEQGRGRIDRLNTPYIDLYYYMLRSASQIDQMIWKAISTKKDFNEAEVKAIWARK